MRSVQLEVRRIATAYAAKHAPLTPQSLCDGIGALLRYTTMPEGKFGSYIESKQLIVINETSSPKRQRFTVAHEVMHALIYQREDLLSDMHDAWQGEAFEFNLEVMCNIGASEMLLPSAKLEAAIAQYGLKPKLIPELATSFQVSEETVAVALSAREQPCVAMVVWGQPPRASFVAHHPELDVRIAKGQAFSINHPIREVAETGLPYKGTYLHNGVPLQLQCLARGRQLYALLTPPSAKTIQYNP